MPLNEIDYLWTFTSTGNGTAIDGRTGREWTFHVECPSGSTGEVEIQTAQNSTAIAVVIGSSQAIASSGGAGVVLQFSGPFASIWPRCIKLTASGTMRVRGVAN